MITIMELTPNTIYTFNVSANNSLGFGDSASVQCTTTGNGKNYKYINNYNYYNYTNCCKLCFHFTYSSSWFR